MVFFLNTDDSAPIPVPQNISNPLKRPIVHQRKSTSMSTDAASTSISNVEGSVTRSRVRINMDSPNQRKSSQLEQVIEAGVGSTGVPIIPQNRKSKIPKSKSVLLFIEFA